MTSLKITIGLTVLNIVFSIINYRRSRQLNFSARILEVGTEKLVQFRDLIKQTYYDSVRLMHDQFDKHIQAGNDDARFIEKRDKMFVQLIEMELGDELKVL